MAPFPKVIKLAIFKKNPNEVNYPNGKKPFLSIIKNEGSPEALIWKVPYEDFNQHSKVIVDENQDVLFYKNGVIEEVLSAGEYDLSTGNYPFLSRIRNSISDGVSAYNCKIFYVNKVHKLDNKWGTTSPVQVMDMHLSLTGRPIRTDMMARGSFTLQIVDSKKFFLKYVGANYEQLTPAVVAQEFRAPINQKIRELIGKSIQALDVEIQIVVASMISDVADSVQAGLEPAFDEYGMRLVHFYIEALEILDNEERKQAMAGRAEQARYAELGINYQTERTFDVLETAAGNEGAAGTAMGAGMGLGMGVGMGVPMGNGMYQMTSNNMAPNNGAPAGPAPSAVKCAACGAAVPSGSKFCPGCGAPIQVASFCPACGTKAAPGSAFCSNCGGRLRWYRKLMF